MCHSSRILCCLSLLLIAPATTEARPMALTRVQAPIPHAIPRISLHSAARGGVRANAPLRVARPPSRPGSARLNTLATLQRVGLRNGRVPRLGNGFGLFGVGLGLSTAEDLALPLPADGEVPAAEGPQSPLPRCVRPQIIKIGQGVRRKARPRIVYGPVTGCTRY